MLGSQMDLDDLEKQWEEGDDEEELKTEQQTKFERLERRRKEAQAKAGSLDPRHVRRGGYASAPISLLFMTQALRPPLGMLLLLLAVVHVYPYTETVRQPFFYDGTGGTRYLHPMDDNLRASARQRCLKSFRMSPGDVHVL